MIGVIVSINFYSQKAVRRIFMASWSRTLNDSGGICWHFNYDKIAQMWRLVSHNMTQPQVCCLTGGSRGSGVERNVAFNGF